MEYTKSFRTFILLLLFEPINADEALRYLFPSQILTIAGATFELQLGFPATTNWLQEALPSRDNNSL